MVNESNAALRQTLADTLAQQQEAAGVPRVDMLGTTTRLLVDSPGHRLLDLVDSLLVGEEVDAQAVLAARSALLQSAGNMWKPLGVDFSGATGGDWEVNQSLARLLGTGGEEVVERQLTGISESEPYASQVSHAAGSLASHAAVSRRTVDWDVEALGTCGQGAGGGEAGAGRFGAQSSGANVVVGRTLSLQASCQLAAYRPGTSMRTLHPRISRADSVMLAQLVSPPAATPALKALTSPTALRRMSSPITGTMADHADARVHGGAGRVAGEALSLPDQGDDKGKLSSKAKGWSKRLRRSSWFQVRAVGGKGQLDLGEGRLWKQREGASGSKSGMPVGRDIWFEVRSPEGRLKLPL